MHQSAKLFHKIFNLQFIQHNLVYNVTKMFPYFAPDIIRKLCNVILPGYHLSFKREQQHILHKDLGLFRLPSSNVLPPNADSTKIPN